jgi:uncharacterized protein (TIGR02246 family)
MKNLTGILLLMGLGTLMALAADSKLGEVEAVRQAERAWAQAALKGDAAALDKILADDMTHTHGGGRTESKAQFLEAIRSGAQKYEAIDYDEIKVRVYGSTAIVTSEPNIRTVNSGVPSSSHSRFLHVYVKQGGAWRLVAHQSTRITP